MRKVTRFKHPTRQAKVLVVVIDGASSDLVYKWSTEGKLPNLANIISTGASGILNSTIPAVSLPAFTSLATGKNPGKHGIFGFTNRQFSNYYVSIANRTNAKGVPLWRLLDEEGKNVVIVNMPLLYPPEKVNGVIISGMLSPEKFDSRSTFPPCLYNELKEKIGDYQIDVKEEYVEGREEIFLNDLFYTLEKRAQCILYLLEKYDWDLFIAVFTCIDRIQHFFWKYMDEKHPAFNSDKAKKFGSVILQCYQKVDQIIGKIICKIDVNTTVIVMSDHGFGPEHKELFLNNWLMEIGLLKLKKKLGVHIKFILRKSGLIGKMLKVAQIISRKMGKALSIMVFTYEKVTQFPGISWFSDIDWEKTKAYAIGDGGKIYVNVKGRDPHGIVEPEEEYETIRDYLVKALYKLRDPQTGERIIENVWKKEELYWGPYLNNAPDLIFISRGMIYRDRPGFGRAIVDVPLLESGTHRINGILLMKGSNIARGVQIENARIWDVAPTILYLMNESIPLDMDGKVVTEVLNPHYLRRNPIKYIRAIKQVAQQKYLYSKKEEEEIKKRLKALGYL